MSGQNRLVLSENMLKGGSKSALDKCLENSNTEAIRITESKPVPKKPSDKPRGKIKSN